MIQEAASSASGHPQPDEQVGIPGGVLDTKDEGDSEYTPSISNGRPRDFQEVEGRSSSISFSFRSIRKGLKRFAHLGAEELEGEDQQVEPPSGDLMALVAWCETFA